ncbi:hypothetical protein K7472_07885 [Streptomyces sp. PTM05]|uniref:Uncharacterized protein n=1 Tax=Streptantibioticus parmotrematis TaxID=2873249 RepID=A0ABS7QQ27_9ACTN|nr:hypothetical protein [Streptantibioticus parmotrematis]MBY8884764.1 hypothetical protein [Streptantibioticus parmotrematis]
MVRPLPSHSPVGYRRDGRPVYPICGASPEDESNEQLDDEGTSEPQQITVTQDRLGKLLTREKAQGERAAIRRLLGTLGFDSSKELVEFVTAQREAERSALSEVERREQAIAEREVKAARREQIAAERERAALRRAVLVSLGAAGEDLADAERLLATDDDADEAQVAAAAEALRSRRPELFGQTRTPVTAAPGGAPAGRAPTRTAPAQRPGAAGLEMARRRGLVPVT